MSEAGETDLSSLLSTGSSNMGRDRVVSSAPSAWGKTWKGSEREDGGSEREVGGSKVGRIREGRGG